MESDKIIVVGAGYVGLVAACCFSSAGYSVTVVENNVEKLESLQRGHCPFYEPGLSEMLKDGIESKRLQFSSNQRDVWQNFAADFVFCAVGTPEDADGSANLSGVEISLQESIAFAPKPFVFVIKSTVPVGTGQRLQELVKSLAPGKAEVVNNPEFLKEGTAVSDFVRPERVVLGGQPKATDKVAKLYSSFLLSGKPLILTDSASAELGKLGANLMLASRISVINQIARVSTVVEADIRQVERILQTDSRIGSKYLFAGLGFGGSCFPKDIQSFMHLCKKLGVDDSVARAIDSFNDAQKLFFVPHIKKALAKGSIVSLLGLSFKPETDDIRESPALSLTEALLNEGYTLRVIDPKAQESFRAWAKSKKLSGIHYSTSIEDCLRGAHAVVLVTEWQEYQRLNAEKLRKIYTGKFVFDGKNVLPNKDLSSAGFQYLGIGRS